MTDLSPANELERALIAAHAGEISPEELMQALVAAQLFMPILDRHGIGNLQTSQSAHPLTLETEDGEQVMVLFTTPERAKPFLRDFPGYGGGLLVELKWIVEKLGGGMGIALNPGWEAGIDLEPGMVEQLAGSEETA